MTTKKKNRIVLLVSCALAVVLLVVLLLVILKNPEDEPDPGPAEDTSVVLFARDANKLVRLSYAYNDNITVFVRQENGWVLEDEPSFPLNSEMVDTQATYIASVKATRTVGKDTGDYGLTPPVIRINATYEDGAKDELLVGNYNSFLAQYYVAKEETVYLVSPVVNTLFTRSIYDMIKLDSLPEGYSEDVLVRMELTTGDGQTKVITDLDTLLELNDISSKIPLTSYVDASIAANEREVYGLTQPAAVLKVYWKNVVTENPEVGPVTREDVLTYTFGRTLPLEDGSHMTVFTFGDSGILYEMESSVLNEILAFAGQSLAMDV